MEHYEIHIIHSPADAEVAVELGLLEDLEDLYCEACDEVVGEDESGEFLPFAVVLDSDDVVWLSCEDCYSPVIYPASEFD